MNANERQDPDSDDPSSRTRHPSSLSANPSNFNREGGGQFQQNTGDAGYSNPVNPSSANGYNLRVLKLLDFPLELPKPVSLLEDYPPPVAEGWPLPLLVGGS